MSENIETNDYTYVLNVVGLPNSHSDSTDGIGFMLSALASQLRANGYEADWRIAHSDEFVK